MASCSSCTRSWSTTSVARNAPPRTTGEWNSFTGRPAAGRTSPSTSSGFAGNQVEVSITYVTDPGTGGIGAFVDDTQVVVDGDATPTGSRVTRPAGRSAAPAGQPAERGQLGDRRALVHAFAGIATEDSLLLGFGFEQLSDDAARQDLVDRALSGLIK